MSNTESGLSKIVTTLANGTVYAPDPTSATDVTGKLGINTRRCNHFTAVIDNPAGRTTTYTIEGSNMTDDECKAGGTAWKAYTGAPPLTLVGAVTDYIEILDWAFARARIKCASDGVGTATERVCTKTQG